MERVGPFYFRPGVLQRRQLERLREIAPFFTPQIMRELLTPVALQTFEVSLRALDYMCTNYAKKTQILTELPASSGQGGLPVHVYTLYKDWLKHYRRKTFDPFRRRQRIFFIAHAETGEGELVEDRGASVTSAPKVLDTTVAQVNFLRWAMVYGVVSYVKRNAAAIEQDMLTTLNESKQRRREDAAQGIKRRRSELSKAPAMKCIVYELPQRLFFEETAANPKQEL